MNQSSNNDVLVQQVPSDAISHLGFAPNSNLLVASSWDSTVCCWDVQQNGQAVPKAQIKHDAPVLCTAWSTDGQRVFSAGCDKQAKMWPLGANATQIAQHDAPIQCCKWVQELNSLATASWDKKLRYWDTRTPNPVADLTLPERAYCMDISYPLMAVGTADRHVVLYDLRNPQTPSPLKYQSRCITCFPDKSGFAIGSVEGRVGIQHVEARDSAKNFAFKCHRVNQDVFPVTSISFHPVFGTFSTTGSDGNYCFWDKENKQRLKQSERCSQPITCGDFNATGTIFAYATSYDWYKGHEGANPSMKPQIFLHAVKEEEVKPRGKAKR